MKQANGKPREPSLPRDDAPSAQKFIEKKAPHHMRGRLQTACEALSREPRPYGCEKLIGQENIWRIREGDYRIVYIIYDKEMIIETFKLTIARTYTVSHGLV